MTEDIKNLPEYAKSYHYIVVSVVDKELWFYGAYNEWERAVEAVKDASKTSFTRFIITNDEF